MPHVTRPRRVLPEGKAIKFSHNPFTLDIDDKTKISCNENGELTVIQEGDDKEYDQVVLPASAFYKTIDMLALTRSSRIVDKSEIPRKVKDGRS